MIFFFFFIVYTHAYLGKGIGGIVRELDPLQDGIVGRTVHNELTVPQPRDGTEWRTFHAAEQLHLQ
jgi:hypothetical protein